MENKELVSVVVPVYNVEKYLRQCIDSVLAQTYEHFEIILVDDGSTDESKAICEEYIAKDDRIRLVCQKNAGASAARNRGLKVSEGAYIYFLDSDDWLERTALQELVEKAAREKAEVVFFKAYSIDDDSGRISDKHYNHKKNYPTDIGYKILKEQLNSKEFHVTPWSMFFRRDFLERTKISFIEGIIYEDMVFAYKVFCEAKCVAHLPKFLYYRRYRENSVMTSKIRKKNFDSAVRVYEEVVAFSNKLDCDKRCDKHIVRCAYNVLNVYERLDIENRKICAQILKVVKKEILHNNAHEDIALKLRCYHKVLWAGYKALQKICGLVHIKVKG